MVRPIVKKIAGYGLLAMGLVFLITPFTPGSLLFFGLGAKWSGAHHHLPEKWRNRFTRKKKK